MNYAPGEHFRNHARSLSGGNDFVSELNEAIRQNPLPAALIGAGVLWMFMGGAKNTVLGGASRSVLHGLGYGAQQAGGTIVQAGGAISGGIGRAAESIADAGSRAVGAMGEAVSSAVSHTASQVSETAKAAYDGTSGALGSAGSQASNTVAGGAPSITAGGAEIGKGLQQLANTFAKQPLLLGAIGLAVGAAFAASMPTTAMESQLMGETAASLKEKTGDLWDETKTRAEAVASKGLDELKAQGLTPAAAGEALRDVTDKALGVAEKAKDGVAKRITGTT